MKTLHILAGGGYDSALLLTLISIYLVHDAGIALPEGVNNIELSYYSYGHKAEIAERNAVYHQMLAFSSMHRDTVSIRTRMNATVLPGYERGSTNFKSNHLFTGNPNHTAEITGRNEFLISLVAKRAVPGEQIWLGAAPSPVHFADCTPEFFEAMSEKFKLTIKAPLLAFPPEDDYEMLVASLLDHPIMQHVSSCWAPPTFGADSECGVCAHCVKASRFKALAEMTKFRPVASLAESFETALKA